jgi:hypothetical protein
MAGQLVFRGSEVVAKYKDVPEDAYKHNPYVEALPPIMDWKQIGKRIKREPAYDEDDRLLASEIRLQLVQTIDNFVLPLPYNVDLANRFSRTIRNGYMARNPIKAEWRKQMRSAFKNLKWGTDDDDYEPLIRSTASGFTVVGCSGLGKTTAIESALGLYPQVIQHTKYNETSFPQKQLVWLKLDCPKDGSLKSMCLSFFKSIDEVLKTDYSRKFKRYSVDNLLIEMGHVSNVFGLGVLVIDEIQRLNEAKSGGAQVMINTFVELINTIGVPVVLVGTFKALHLLRNEFATARRSAGQGDLVWTNMVQDELWEFFVEKLWEYQWTKVKTPLTNKLKKALYDESQGIIDIAVKLYKLVQWRVIGLENEKITVSLIRQVAKDSLRIAQPMLKALKENNEDKLKEYSDLYFDLDEYLKEAKERVTILGVKNNLLNQSKASKDSKGDTERSPIATIVKWLVEAGVEAKMAKECANKALESFGTDYNVIEAMHYAYELALNKVADAEEKKLYEENQKKQSLYNKEEMQGIIDETKGTLNKII